MNEQTGINKRVADRLYTEGRIGEDEYRQVIELARREQIRVEEALLELDVLPETTLLKFIATLHKTQFVSTERMSKAKVDQEALKVVPRGLARHFGVYPLVLDRKADKLIVATADPDDAQALHELRMGAGVARVVAMVARPEAVVAAIDRGYENDRRRFRSLLHARPADFEEKLMGERTAPRDRIPQRPMHDDDSAEGRRQRGTVEPRTGEYAPPRRTSNSYDDGTGRRRPTVDDWDVDEPHRDRDTDRSYGGRAATGRGRHPDELDERDDDAPRRPRGRRPTADVEPPHERRATTGRERPDGRYQEVPAEDELLEDYVGRGRLRPADAIEIPADRVGHADVPQAPILPGRPAPRGKPVKRQSSMFPRPVVGLTPLGPEGEVLDPVEPKDLFSNAAFAETLRVFVGLLENERINLRGHSAAVARLGANICERISLSETQTHQIVLGCYLHDLGKMGAHHLTALNVAQIESHFDLAQKLVRLPEQLMESVGLPDSILEITRGMYERVAGGGLPDGVQAKDIPIGARILAVADSYADLTRNPDNPYERILTPEEALDVLRQHAETVFDPNIIDMLERATGGEQILTDLLSNQHRVLVVDPDPEETMVLQLRLVEQGFDVHVARSTEEAEQAFAASEFALVVCEVDVETPEAGFTLRKRLPKEGLSWVFLSSRDTRDVVERALKLGADDFIAKPVSHEIFVAKLSKLVEKKGQREAPRGVAGSLAQMGIPEVVQILWHGRKTCSLNLTSQGQSGQIHFEEGAIVNALWGDASGEVAFFRMVALGDDGEFAVDPEFVPSERTIQASPDYLLLEGMRLLDEGAIP